MDRQFDQTSHKKTRQTLLSCSQVKQPDIKSHYTRFRAHVQKVIRDAYWKHISNIFSFDMDSADPDCPQKMRRRKNFGHLSSRSRKTRLGSLHSEKIEFLKLTLSIRLISAIDNLSQLSHANLILKSPKKALVHSPPWVKSQVALKGS